MNLAHELELDSQSELLERLQLLTRFGSNLVNVYGVQGAGKSWLAQRYLERWADDKNQALLMCHPNQNDEQHRTTILSQLVSEPLFNPKDSLADSFSRLYADSGCDIVVVIDDAHLLSETIVSELWMWILESQANPLWTVNVVLFVQSNSLEPLLTRLSYGQELKPIDLEIEALSEEEADRLFESRVMRFIDDSMERRTRQAYKKAKRIPGDIMALSEQKTEKKIIIRSIIASPLNITLVVLVLLLLIGGGYWWMLSQSTPINRTAAPLADTIAPPQQEQTAIPTLNTASSATSASGSDSSSQSQAMNVTQKGSTAAMRAKPSLDGSVDDSAALPPDVKENSVGVGQSEDDQQRVVIDSNVVDALMENNSKPADTAAIDSVVQQAQTTAPAQVDNTPVVPATGSFAMAEKELKAMSPRSYTLQLAAVKSLPEVQTFLGQYRLEGKVNVYPTLRNGAQWYIITYENYPTIQLARDAVETLPGRLQALGPWAKSLSQVQREIDRVK